MWWGWGVGGGGRGGVDRIVFCVISINSGLLLSAAVKSVLN